ncbi:hypothetical protein V8C86DRAFT_1440788 [Haematococcus lacustris]
MAHEAPASGCLAGFSIGRIVSWLADIIQPDIPDSLCEPRGLYRLKENVNLRKLRGLIRNGTLVPCFPGAEEATVSDLEQQNVLPIVERLLKRKKQCVHNLAEVLAEWESCAICFLHYPLLNTSRCCAKRICTECLLQVQTSAACRSLLSCPFCRVAGFSARFVSVKSLEVWQEERQEEQKLVEARKREREAEIQRDRERALQRTQQAQAQAQGQAATAAAGG